MSLSEIQPGRLQEIDSDQKSKPIFELADKAADALRSSGSSYAFHFCVPDHLQSVFDSRLLKKAGKRHFSRYRSESAFDTIQRLQHATPFLPKPIRRKVLEELLRISSATDIPQLTLSEIDNLVATDPHHPISAAYTTALESLGYQHPYSLLDDTPMAVSVVEIFVAEFDSLPIPVQSWLLDHLPSGIHLTITTLGSQVIDRCCTSSIDPPESWRHFDHAEAEVRAVVHACADRSVDTVYCISHQQQRDVEMQCILRDIPVHIQPTHSLLHSIEIRYVVAYLDWIIDESESALLVILELIGTKSQEWTKYSRRHQLPRRLSVGCYLSELSESSGNSTRDNLVALSELLTSAHMHHELSDHLSMLNDWALPNIPGFDAEVFSTVIRQSTLVDIQPKPDAFRRSLYRAISLKADDAVRIRTITDIDHSMSERAWALVDGDSSSTSFLSRLRPIVSRELIISRHD